MYDNFVANHKQIKQGDWAIIIDKKELLGFVKIESITTQPSKKKRERCPKCGETNFEARKNKLPLYRCNRGHEFSKPIQETVESTNYIASYSSFIKPNKSLPISSLRPFYSNNYNRNMSIQLLDDRFFDNYFKDIPKSLSVNTLQYLSATQAENIVNEPIEAYIPGSDDERDKIFRQIKERRGQKKFRDQLRQRYGNMCMITGCQLLDILEAAHINPYKR